MDAFELVTKNNLEQLIFMQEETVGLQAVFVIYNTFLGPAIGGIRIMDYSSHTALIQDAVELAREMTMRTALAGCDFGGGSAIIWKAPKTKDEAFFRALGQFIERLRGQFYAVMEVGTDTNDLRNIKRETDYVLALPEAYGGIADSTEITSLGVFEGIKAAAKHAFGTSELKDMSFLVQGVGRLGSTLVNYLSEAGGKVTITDINFDKIKNIQDKHPEIEMVKPDKIMDVKADIIVPCAVGNLVTSENIDQINWKVVAGAASNILPDIKTGSELHKKGVLYVPHFVIDAGSIILADFEKHGYNSSLLRDTVSDIYSRTLSVLEAAEASKEPPVLTALNMAQNRLERIAGIGRHITI